MREARKEYILCAAIHYKTGAQYVHQPKNIITGVVICGRRHHNCIATKAMTGIPRGAPAVQGFITSKDMFVDREEAARIAYAANQIDHALADEDGDDLTLISEDLY